MTDNHVRMNNTIDRYGKRNRRPVHSPRRHHVIVRSARTRKPAEIGEARPGSENDKKHFKKTSSDHRVIVKTFVRDSFVGSVRVTSPLSRPSLSNRLSTTYGVRFPNRDNRAARRFRVYSFAGYRITIIIRPFQTKYLIIRENRVVVYIIFYMFLVVRKRYPPP